MKHQTIENTLYSKRMFLKSSGLTVEVKEKADYSFTNTDEERVENIKPAEVLIYHSPGKFNQDRFSIRLKDRKALKEYIAMLVDFEKRFGDLLDKVQKPGDMRKEDK